jgi:hypothetical protein
MNRRELLTGIAACAGVATLPALPVVAIENDLLVRGIRWQSWPFGTRTPHSAWESGEMSRTANDLMPMSYFVDKYCCWPKNGDPVYIEAIP